MPEGFKVDVEKAVGFKSPVEIVSDPSHKKERYLNSFLIGCL